ncbi:MAG: hypothetical protein WC763_06510 [Candidatus Paceibacterota bacterium]
MKKKTMPRPSASVVVMVSPKRRPSPKKRKSPSPVAHRTRARVLVRPRNSPTRRTNTSSPAANKQAPHGIRYWVSATPYGKPKPRIASSAFRAAQRFVHQKGVGSAFVRGSPSGSKSIEYDIGTKVGSNLYSLKKGKIRSRTYSTDGLPASISPIRASAVKRGSPTRRRRR